MLIHQAKMRPIMTINKEMGMSREDMQVQYAYLRCLFQIVAYLLGGAVPPVPSSYYQNSSPTCNMGLVWHFRFLWLGTIGFIIVVIENQ